MKKGDLVWMTSMGVKGGLLGRARSRLGVVVDVSLGTWLRLKVRRDGLKGASWYSGAFWRKASRRQLERTHLGRRPVKGMR